MQGTVLQRFLSSQIQNKIYMPVWEKAGTTKGNKYRQEITKVQGKIIFDLSIGKPILD